MTPPTTAAPRSNPITTPTIVPAWLWLVRTGTDVEVAVAFVVVVDIDEVDVKKDADEALDRVDNTAVVDDVVGEEDDEEDEVVGYSCSIHSLLTQE